LNTWLATQSSKVKIAQWMRKTMTACGMADAIVSEPGVRVQRAGA
jgi:hypothetical protein